ncbi:plasmid pRiA4b ORF-3 family protein [Brucella sp. 22210]|uniref:plasmid pRiA4b ORF-3 family protein n=1 Tax=Brucella sp. 22210 TaxID=3453892 RepID=UPI003F86C9F8
MELDIGPSTYGIGIMISRERIARIIVKLDHIDPAIWRRVEVPITTSLKGLHNIIQAVMPFQDYHLFEFNAGGKHYAGPDRAWDFGRETYAARNVRIGALVDRGITIFNYNYDFGDDWRHSITVEAVADADPAVEYRRVVDGERRTAGRCRRIVRLRGVPQRNGKASTCATPPSRRIVWRSLRAERYWRRYNQ